MAVDFTGALAGLGENLPTAKILERKIEAINAAQAALQTKCDAEDGETASTDIELINALKRTPVTIDDVYTFQVRLCDNKVDKDYERFSRKTLEKLSEICIGAKGIFADDKRRARIYKATVVEEGGAAVVGEPLCSLRVWAYIERNPENENVIAKIDAGINREISISCSMLKRICSICGSESCDHQKGRRYGGKVCYYTLELPVDFYEWGICSYKGSK